ncbi:hypothetical protein ACF063_18125 [Streptomyces chartreusis]
MEKSRPSQETNGKIREVAGRLTIALGARALWSLIEKLFSHHFEG